MASERESHDDTTSEPHVRYVVWPGLLRREREEGAFSLYHPGHGTSLDVEEESAALVECVLAGFDEPKTREEFARAEPEVAGELVDYLIRSLFVVDESELPFLEHGFLRPAAPPVGLVWSWSDLPERAEPGLWCLLGVPVDMGALGSGGARHGPSEIRKVLAGSLFTEEGDVLDHELGRLYRAPRPPLIDLGDIDPEGARSDHVGLRIRKVVRELVRLGMRPLILGGDHSLTHFVVTELVREVPRLGIIHFDAHADFGPSRTVTHANIFEVARDSPQIERILQIGLRVVERVSPFATRVHCAKRTVITARDTKAGLAAQAIAALPRDIPYYLTFDIDCIDAAIVRETGTPAFGGLSVEQATELVDLIARELDLLGADFVEVSSAQLGVNAGATIAASLLSRCVLGQTPFEPLTSDIYVFGP
jgi:arginase family enzyme